MLDSRTLDPYFDRLTKGALLTKDDEQRLGALVLAGQAAQAQLDVDRRCAGYRALQRAVKEGKAAQEQFVFANTRLVVGIARKYRWAACEQADLVQEGIMGLMHAAEKFDHTRGFKFSTYATYWIKQHIGAAIEKTGRAIRLPGAQDELVRKLSKYRDDMLNDLGHEPSPAELAAATKASPEDVELLLRTDEAPLSLDAPSQHVGSKLRPSTLADIIADPGSDPLDLVTVNSIDWESDLGKLINQLLPSQKEVLLLRFTGPGMSRKEAAAHLGLKLTALQSLERRARNNLRLLSGRDGLYECGTRQAYNGYGCKCDRCITANSLYVKEKNARQKVRLRELKIERGELVAV